MTCSRRHATACATRRATHDWQSPRRLQVQATSLSWPHSAQRRLRTPCAWMPHSRRAPNWSTMKRGGSAPVLCFGAADEAGRNLLHEALQRDPFPQRVDRRRHPAGDLKRSFAPQSPRSVPEFGCLPAVRSACGSSTVRGWTSQSDALDPPFTNDIRWPGLQVRRCARTLPFDAWTRPPKVRSRQRL